MGFVKEKLLKGRGSHLQYGTFETCLRKIMTLKMAVIIQSLGYQLKGWAVGFSKSKGTKKEGFLQEKGWLQDNCM